MKVMRIMIKIQNWLGIPHFTREANFPWNRPIGTCHRWVDLLIEGCGGRFALDKFTMSNLVPKTTLPSHLHGFLLKIHYCMTWSEKKGLHLASINYLWINNQNIPFFRLEIYQLNLEYLKPTMMFTYSMVLRVGLLATRFPLDVLSQFDVSFLANNLAVHVVQTSPLDVLGKMCYVTTNKNSRLLRVNCISCEYNKSCTKKPVCAVMYHHIFYNYLHIIVAPSPPPSLPAQSQTIVKADVQSWMGWREKNRPALHSHGSIAFFENVHWNCGLRLAIKQMRKRVALVLTWRKRGKF